MYVLRVLDHRDVQMRVVVDARSGAITAVNRIVFQRPDSIVGTVPPPQKTSPNEPPPATATIEQPLRDVRPDHAPPDEIGGSLNNPKEGDLSTSPPPSAMVSGTHSIPACAAVAPAATFKFEAHGQTERKNAQCIFDKLYLCACCRFDTNGTSFYISRTTCCAGHASSSTGRASWTSDAKRGAANSDARLIGLRRRRVDIPNAPSSPSNVPHWTAYPLSRARERGKDRPVFRSLACSLDGFNRNHARPVPAELFSSPTHAVGLR